MSHVSYNGKRLIPAPFVSLERVFQRTANNTIIGSLWEGKIEGTIVSYKGSPSSSGVFWTLGGYPSDETLTDSNFLGAILRKQEAISNLFSTDGNSLEFQSEDGTFPLKCFPTITNISFQAGQWYYESNYNISFQAPKIYGTIDDGYVPQFLSDASESWQIETEQEPQGLEASKQRIYRVTHNLSAVGKTFPGNTSSDSLTVAKDWVQARLGLDSSYATSLIVGSSGSAYNYVRSETTGLMDGQYSITETWILAPDYASETFNIETRKSIDTGLTTVTINGIITGLESAGTTGMPTVVTTKYENAQSKWTTVYAEIFARALSYSSISDLNVNEISSSVQHNPVEGTITYSYEYNNRPSNLITGAKSEIITIFDSLNTNIVAIIPVLGRTVGPVLQNINTSRERTRTLNIEVVMDNTLSNTFTNPLISLVSGLVAQANPSAAFGASQVYLTENNYNWEPKSNRGSCVQTWIYEI